MAKLRQVRLSHGLGLNETAREAGISPSCLSRLERGLAQNPRHAEIMARFFEGEITEAEILYPRRHAAQQHPRGKNSKVSTAA